MHTTWAQKSQGTITGIVIDSILEKPLSEASITVLKQSDSSFQTLTVTDRYGKFTIKKLDSGRYIILIIYQGLETIEKLVSLSLEQPAADIGIIQMRVQKTLPEIRIQDKIPLKVRGDTISYKADAFHTAPDATVEELIRKLPGLSVDKEGHIKAQGEAVQKLFVNGKEFFSGDPQVATKNLTADMVEQVQVFHDENDGVKWGGMDEGSRIKVLNLKLKKDRKKGWLNNANAGYGPDQRFSAAISSLYFKGNTQVGLIGSANNINQLGSTQVGLSSQAEQGSSNGLMTTSSLGMNYHNLLGRNLEVQGSYRVVSRKENGANKNFQEGFFGDSTLQGNGISSFKNDNTNHQVDVKIVFTPDTLNSIMYAPSVSVQKSKAFYLDTLEQFVMHPSYFYKTGNSRTSNQIENTGYTLVNNLAWRHRFQKAGQSFTATFSNIRSKGQTLTDNIIRSQFYDIQGGLIQSRSSNLKIESLAPTNTVLAGLIYTAPVGWSSNMQIQYNFYNNKTEINKNTFAYQGTSDSSLGIVDSLTNNFNNELFWNRIGLLLRHINNRYQYQLGLGVQQTRVVGKDQVKDMIWKKDFINPVPFALLIYQLNQNKSLQLNYRGQSRQPTALQLQDITDVTNYPFIERGNPNLKQEFIHHLMLIYNSFNVATYNSFFAYLSLDQTNHKISNSITQSSGEQLIVPINVKGAYNINGTISFGLPFQKMQSGSFSTSTQINYGRNFNLLNGIVNSVNTINGSEEVQVAYNFNEHLDMKGQINWMFNSLRIADNQRGINNFWEGEHFLQVNWKTSSGFMFSTTGSYHIFPEGERSYNQGYLIWNISLSKKLLKDRRGTLTFLAHDLLNQNQNIYRRVFNNYIENVQTTTLKRYFLLSFSYRFQKK